MIKYIPFVALFVLASCGAPSEEDAKRTLENEVAVQVPIACDCIAAVDAEGDTYIEEVSDCKGTGQIAIYELAREDKLDDVYPEMYQAVMDDYYAQVDACEN